MPLANPLRGEAPLGEHKLIVDFNRFCTLEAAVGKKVEDLVAGLQVGLGFLELRTWVRVFLDSDMTSEEAGTLIGALGLDETLEAVAAAVAAFFAPTDKGRKGKGKNPPKAE